MGPSQESFSLSEISLPPIFLCWCYGVCFLISAFYVVAAFTNRCSIIWFSTATALWSMPMVGIYGSWYWFLTHARVHQVATPPLLWLGGFCATQTAVPGFHAKWWDIQLGAWQRVICCFHLAHILKRAFFFSGLVSSVYIVGFKIVVGVKPGDYSVMTGYQVITLLIYLAECLLLDHKLTPDPQIICQF